MSKLPKHIELENEKLRLVELTMDHLDSLTKIAVEQPDLVQYSPTPFGSREAVIKLIEAAISDRAIGTRIAFAIFDKQSDAYIGTTSFGSISLHNKRLEIGWTWIDKKFQGTGLNKNCKCLLMTFAFEQLMIERLEFRTDSRNIQSQRAIEKLGAKKEGVLRSHMLMLDGYRRDSVYYSILKVEWPKIKKKLSF